MANLDHKEKEHQESLQAEVEEEGPETSQEEVEKSPDEPER